MSDENGLVNWVTLSDGGLYRAMTAQLISRMAEMRARGCYDEERAKRAFFRIATEGAKRFNRELTRQDVENREWHQQFPAHLRRSAAGRIMAYYEEAMREEAQKARSRRKQT